MALLAGAGAVVFFSGKGTMNDTLTNNGGETAAPVPYVEITNPSGFVNTNDQPIKIADYIGKQVILLDVMTYSCINCQRTFPYITKWYETYKDEGLMVIGIHTPEFAFEKDKQNVEKAMKEFGITFPVVLDNDYGTWNAFKNHYWPHKYLIDIHGNIVYDHVGEGAYEETEAKIQELLQERAEVLGEQVDVNKMVSDTITATDVDANSPETYFGSLRNEYLANGTSGTVGEQSFILPQVQKLNSLYLGGVWNLFGEFAAAGSNASVLYKYNAKEVYIVAEAKDGGTIEVLQDGTAVTDAGGADVHEGNVEVRDSRLYKLIKNDLAEEHTLQLNVSPGVKLFAFTFG